MAAEDSEVLQRLQFEIHDTVKVNAGVFQKLPPSGGCSLNTPHQIFNVIDSNDVHVGDIYNLTINKIVPPEDRTRNNIKEDIHNLSEQENDFAEDGGSSTTLTVDGGRISENSYPSKRSRLLWGGIAVALLAIFSIIVTLILVLRDNENVEEDFVQELLPINCGIGNSEGNNSVLEEYPWLAVIHYETNAGAQKQIFSCSGSLINNRYVLTSARCANLPSNLIARVRLGDQAADRDNSSVYVGVDKVIPHPEWSSRWNLRLNDIALLRLDSEITFNRKTSISMVKELVRVHDGLECSKNEKTEFEIDDNFQMCATSLQIGPECCCSIGSTMVTTYQMTDDKNRYYLMGVLSYRSTRCDDTEIPSEYTRVDAYMPWIKSELRP